MSAGGVFVEPTAGIYAFSAFFSEFFFALTTRLRLKEKDAKNHEKIFLFSLKINIVGAMKTKNTAAYKMYATVVISSYKKLSCFAEKKSDFAYRKRRKKRLCLKKTFCACCHWRRMARDFMPEIEIIVTFTCSDKETVLIMSKQEKTPGKSTL